MVKENYWSDKRGGVVYGNPYDEITSISDLRKEFPDDKYFLVRDKNVLRKFGRTLIGVYMVAEMSPNKKTQKQQIMYWRVK